MLVQQQVTEAFAVRFGASPTWVVRAPGRVNLIGEHTDYNDGFVLPMAVEPAAWIALHARGDNQVRLTSLNFRQDVAFDLQALEHGTLGWAEYVKGVAWALQTAGFRLRGWEGVIAGDVPVGAGLSSSAAVEMATARAFAVAGRLAWDVAVMARVGQRAENEWVGVRSGIMDQMISAGALAGHALLIDCRSLLFEAVPLPAGTVVVILDTATRRGLVDSAYNLRREQCEAAAHFFGVRALRDVSLEEFEARAAGLDAETRRRARHVITENVRTLRAADAMRRGDAAEMGRLMGLSHASLRDDFQVSSRELDTMVACASTAAGCCGARMTGAGFGGCAVALVRTEAAQAFSARVIACYNEATGLVPKAYSCQASSGAEVVSNE